MDQLQQEIQELFSDLWQVPRFSGLRAGFRPHVDCFRTDDALTVVVELPGIDRDNVDSSSPRGRSTSPANARAAARRGAGRTSRWRSTTGRSAGRSRSARTSTSRRRSATYEHGMLTIVLPLAQRAARAASAS